jgi:hypothetical protein
VSVRTWSTMPALVLRSEKICSLVKTVSHQEAEIFQLGVIRSTGTTCEPAARSRAFATSFTSGVTMVMLRAGWGAQGESRAAAGAARAWFASHMDVGLRGASQGVSTHCFLWALNLRNEATCTSASVVMFSLLPVSRAAHARCSWAGAAAAAAVDGMGTAEAVDAASVSTAHARKRDMLHGAGVRNLHNNNRNGLPGPRGRRLEVEFSVHIKVTVTSLSALLMFSRILFERRVLVSQISTPLE